MDNKTTHYYKDIKQSVAFGLPCEGLGDTICATPTIRKVSEAYDNKIIVYSKHPEVFKNLSYVESSLHYNDIHENQELKDSYDYYYQTEIALTHFNDQDVKFKHSHMDIRQIHANYIGFTLLKEDSHCDFIANRYEPIDGLPEKYVVIHATESWPSKDWGFENWSSLCNKLNYPIVLVGKESNEKGAFNITKPTYDLSIKRGIDLRNKTDIHQLWHVLDKAQLVITNDSSVMHLSGTTDTEILVLGSSQRPELRFPYRNGSQEYKIRMVLGSCDLFCASDLKYNVYEHGTLDLVGPLAYCLEDKDTFECHPSVDSVLSKVKEIVNVENKFQWGGTPEWLKECIIRDFFVPKYDEYTLYEEKYKINKDDVVLDIGSSCGPFVYKIQDRVKHIYAIEPNSMLTGALKENSNSNVTIIEKAFGKDGSIVLQEHENDALDGLGDPYEIESVSLRSIIKNNNIDYIDFLKIDCESAEYYIFEESVDYIKEKVRYISGEMHLHNDELKEKFRDFYFNFLPHMENYTFSVFDGLEVTEDFKNNFEETLNLYSQILVFIDVLPVVEINPSDDWLEDFENVVGTEVEQYEDFFPIEDGDVVVDFGASTGIFSIPASEKAKMVYAVEPFPNMIDVIKTRVKNIDNIVLDTIPIGDGKEDTLILGGLGDETLNIKSQTFMDFIKKHNIEKIDFLKIDIENSEYYFLSDLDKDNYEDRLEWIKNNVRKLVVEIDCGEDWEYDQALNFFNVVLPKLGGEVRCQWSSGGFVSEYERLTIHRANGTFHTIENGWRNNLKEFLGKMSNFVVHIDMRKNESQPTITKALDTVDLFKPTGGALLAIGQHLSTGGSCEYMLKFLETFKDDYDDIKVIEFSNFGDTLRIHKDKIKDLVGKENVICFGDLHTPMDKWIEEHRELKNVINEYSPDTIWFNELPSGFEYKQPEKELMDWVYREDRPYDIICTTHNNKAFVRDERQSINTLPFYEPDKFVFCTKLHFEFSKDIDIPKELWEYPIENHIRPDRKETLSKLGLEDYDNYYHILQVGIVNANKNQKFSVDLSKKLINKKVMFHFIGNDTMIEGSGVSYEDFKLPNIRYWEERYDVDNFMSCMDLFLFPSLRELNPLSVKQALSWGMEVFALPQNHQHEELNYTLDYLDIDNFHLLKDEDIYEYIKTQEIQPSNAEMIEIDLNNDIRSAYTLLGKTKKESDVVLILDENQNVITDKIYSGTKYWEDYNKIFLYFI